MLVDSLNFSWHICVEGGGDKVSDVAIDYLFNFDWQQSPMLRHFREEKMIYLWSGRPPLLPYFINYLSISPILQIQIYAIYWHLVSNSLQNHVIINSLKSCHKHVSNVPVKWHCQDSVIFMNLTLVFTSKIPSCLNRVILVSVKWHCQDCVIFMTWFVLRLPNN